MPRTPTLCRLVFIALLISIMTGTAGNAHANSGPLYTVRQRFGVNVAHGYGGLAPFPSRISDLAGADGLGFGWYSNWSARLNPERPNGIEYAQLLNTRPWPPDWTTVGQIASANPGSLWIIGNEPETLGQGAHTPEEYAIIYRQAYLYIKGVDPQAQIAIGGVVMPTPLRLEWLRRCLAHYRASYGHPMPVDVWNIHVQILQEKRGSWGCGIPEGLSESEGRLYTVRDNASVEIFRQLIHEFRAWLYDQEGQRDKPVIISEYGVLMPSGYLEHGQESVIHFMEGTFDFLMNARDPAQGYSADEGRLVQRWMWFSLNFPCWEETEGGFNGALYNWRDPSRPNLFGEFYRHYVQVHTLSEPPVPWLYLPKVFRSYIAEGAAGAAVTGDAEPHAVAEDVAILYTPQREGAIPSRMPDEMP
jgi:hypothetical protein